MDMSRNFTYQKFTQNLLSDIYCYIILSNDFHKSTASVNVITQVNSKIQMYKFQENGFLLINY